MKPTYPAALRQLGRCCFGVSIGCLRLALSTGAGPRDRHAHGLVRQHLESFLAHAREHYDGGLPRYVEAELRAYLKCGAFSEGFTRARCDACGHDLLVAFSCKTRTACPSCSGRRMANTAAAIVDRVLPDVPVRQYVLTLPYELRKLAAFKADVLTAIGRIAVEAIFASYRARAKRRGIENGQCGAINFVQRFGSLNLHVHFHVVVLDGVFSRDVDAGAIFHPASVPAREELDAIVRRVQSRAETWLRRRGHLDERALAERSNEPPVQTALDACAAIAMGRGQVATLRNAETPEDGHDESATGKPAVAVERDGFNLHAGVHIERGDDMGRERLLRYGARPPLSLERLRRLPGGRVAYRLKYVTRGRGKFRVMTGLEFMARLAALIAPPRYPLVRYAGVLGPRSAWRKDVVPRPRERRPACNAAVVDPRTRDTARPRAEPKKAEAFPKGAREAGGPAHQTGGVPPRRSRSRPTPSLAPATSSRSRRTCSRCATGIGCSGARSTPPRRGCSGRTLLRRNFDVDVMACAKCGGRLRVRRASSPSASPCGASSRTSACPPRPRRPPERATRPTTWTTSSPPTSSSSGWRREGAPRGDRARKARGGRGAPWTCSTWSAFQRDRNGWGVGWALCERPSRSGLPSPDRRATASYSPRASRRP